MSVYGDMQVGADRGAAGAPYVFQTMVRPGRLSTSGPAKAGANTPADLMESWLGRRSTDLATREHLSVWGNAVLGVDNRATADSGLRLQIYGEARLGKDRPVAPATGLVFETRIRPGKASLSGPFNGSATILEESWLGRRAADRAAAPALSVYANSELGTRFTTSAQGSWRGAGWKGLPRRQHCRRGEPTQLVCYPDHAWQDGDLVSRPLQSLDLV